jgi:hypothetical protein
MSYGCFKNLRTLFEETRYWELAPTKDVANAGWCLGNPGRNVPKGSRRFFSSIQTVACPGIGERFPAVAPARTAFG